jgi:hypothetical protein
MTLSFSSADAYTRANVFKKERYVQHSKATNIPLELLFKSSFFSKGELLKVGG